MQLPPQVILLQIQPKGFYKFGTNRLNTQIAHYFICITISPTLYLMACCTSQIDTVTRLINAKQWPHSSFIYLSPQRYQCLYKDTYVNANQLFAFSRPELLTIINTVSPHHNFMLGEYLNDSDYFQIITAALASPNVERKYKILLPDPNTI